MDEGFSPTIFLYGMALVLAVGKAFTLMIWRTLSKPRPPLKQEVLGSWKRRRLRTQAVKSPPPEQQGQSTADMAVLSGSEPFAANPLPNCPTPPHPPP
jgi:hypothetical protein